MAERAGHDGLEDRRVEHEHRARDRGEPDREQHEQFRTRQPREIGPDQQRRLDHAEKDRGRGAEPDRAADAHDLAQDPGERR